MKLIYRKVNTPKERLLSQFRQYEELEKHHIFQLFSKFYSSRIGMHTYVNGDKVTGYWEGGVRDRIGHLAEVKNWMWLKLKETDNGTIVKGIICLQPSYVMWLVLSYLVIWFTSSFFDFIKAIVITVLFGFLLILQHIRWQKAISRWLDQQCLLAEKNFSVIDGQGGNYTTPPEKE